MTELYADVTGQADALALLKRAVVRPVHAYLFLGPAGSGKRAAAKSFAAALVCPDGGLHADGSATCESCRRALAGMHPDVVSVEREGAFIGMSAAREAVRSAHASPLESQRKVIVLHDFHLVRDTGPALLKTVEEPPATTVFVILADYLPPELVTIASRCVEVGFLALTVDQVADVLEAGGVDPGRAQLLAAAAAGRLDRAASLASDPEVEARRDAWYSIPGRLDESNATAASVADELIALLESSGLPLVARHAEERNNLAEADRRAAEVTGTTKRAKGSRGAKGGKAGGPAMAELDDRQRREARRQRADEFRAGLAVLAGAYRDRLTASVASGNTQRAKVDAADALNAISLVDKCARDLEFNPGELLALQALLARLGRAGASPESARRSGARR